MDEGLEELERRRIRAEEVFHVSLHSLPRFENLLFPISLSSEMSKLILEFEDLLHQFEEIYSFDIVWMNSDGFSSNRDVFHLEGYLYPSGEVSLSIRSYNSRELIDGCLE